MEKIILAIETSCDECAAALVRGDKTILSSVIHTQLETHLQYGGVVPELAARAHLETIQAVVTRALTEAGCGYQDINAVAATIGPGLIGGVLVGANFAKAVALARGLPFMGVNHLEGHALTVRLTDDVAFPYLLLLVSGGHSQILAVLGVGQYRQLGTTLDDAVGECFDKVAKILGLGFPGGPAVEAAARLGQAQRFALPTPMRGRPGCDLSFSGLKTAVRRQVDALLNTQPKGLSPQDRTDMAASFQRAASDCLTDRVSQAMIVFRRDYINQVGYQVGYRAGDPAHDPAGASMRQEPTLVVAGGVAANQTLRQDLAQLARQQGFRWVAPPLALCTDNAAMIGWAGLERFRLGLIDPLTVPTRPRWPLDEMNEGGRA
ncbi:MAG: tRNA (adenosine(37)-N6)-threonylcarbamoyltransferase complex transferase subunit TsaD [Candidatus Symbiobacter sp.]|nr:tRNA (adenosine(37)-N6)-threonylcarbamoyltransferase complex transferase subunit TsaD [Candidatus Symbiobacter sp.]